jgi:ABC-2 type transport system ATP-binding protein
LSLGIEVQKLSKIYKSTKRRFGVIPVSRSEVHALNSIDFNVSLGETVGLLGPNGAGKTTCIKILSTLVLPDKGSVAVNGFDVVRQPTEVRSSIGVITGGERSVYYKLTGRENLILFGRLYRLTRSEAKEQADELLGMMDLSEKADIKCEDYSTGMRMKIVFARSLIHDPPILLYDEPTLGLDPAFAHEIRQFIRDKLNDKCILLATHYMREADFLCDRIDLLHEGNIVASGSPEELKRGIRDFDILNISVQGIIREDAFQNLTGVTQVTVTTDVSDMSMIRVHVNDGASIMRQLLETVEAQGAKVVHLAFEEPTLDDVFIQKVGRRIANDVT